MAGNDRRILSRLVIDDGRMSTGGVPSVGAEMSPTKHCLGRWRCFLLHFVSLGSTWIVQATLLVWYFRYYQKIQYKYASKSILILLFILWGEWCKWKIIWDRRTLQIRRFFYTVQYCKIIGFIIIKMEQRTFACNKIINDFSVTIVENKFSCLRSEEYQSTPGFIFLLHSFVQCLGCRFFLCFANATNFRKKKHLSKKIVSHYSPTKYTYSHLYLSSWTRLYCTLFRLSRSSVRFCRNERWPSPWV